MKKENIKIFLLKITKTSLLSPENYLRHRSWNIHSSTNLRESLIWILKNLPPIVLLPADHPNRRLKALPRLLRNAYPVKVVAFTESNVPSSVPLIHELGAEFQLFPPTSGPSLERLLIKLLKNEDAYLKESAGKEIFNPRTRLVFEALRRGLLNLEDLENQRKHLDDWLFTEFGFSREEG